MQDIKIRPTQQQAYREPGNYKTMLYVRTSEATADLCLSLVEQILANDPADPQSSPLRPNPLLQVIRPPQPRCCSYNLASTLVLHDMNTAQAPIPIRASPT